LSFFIASADGLESGLVRLARRAQVPFLNGAWRNIGVENFLDDDKWKMRNGKWKIFKNSAYDHYQHSPANQTKLYS
jgi:hypothetical protein